MADVTDAEAVQAAVCEVEAKLDPITGVLHGAGRNVPQLLSSLDEAAFLRTLAPKVEGARNVLAAVDQDRLRLFVTFGSIIARTGLPGEADYAVANEWLAHLTERFQAEHPGCRCLNVEWSVWSGLGMGERLGRIDALVREGITPIPPDEGVGILRRLIARPLPAVSVVVTGRYGEAPTLKVEQPDLPFLRFLELPRVYYPGVELVVDTELSAGTDPYLDDHVFRGERLFPAVMGLEAMAQAAMAVVGATGPPDFEDVTFNRAVVLADGESVAIRVAALVRGPDLVEVVLRSEKTAFQVDHFHATCRFEDRGEVEGLAASLPGGEATYVPINPEGDLYGEILFHTGRFRRLHGYRQLSATECLAEIAPGDGTSWFGRHLPAQLVLGDPAGRDAAMHAIQACIPHAPLLPVGVDRLVLGAAQTSGPWFMHARERTREGDTFTYDVEVAGSDGCLRERWEGLRLRMVSGEAFQGPWAGPLLGPYMERRVQELIPGSAVSVAVERDANAERRSRSERTIQRALGKAIPVQRRSDGKPWVADGSHISATHNDDLTLAVAGPGSLGCDVEVVIARPDSVWRDLLGPDRFSLAEIIAREAGEEETVAATRVWTASECLKKAGAMVDAPLALASSTADGWVLLSSGSLVTATFVASVQGARERKVLAVLGRDEDPFAREAFRFEQTKGGRP
jgi:enediyne polyketide synthase